MPERYHDPFNEMEKKISSADALPVPIEQIERRIYVIRGQKVMLDSDLAELYQVPTKRFNEAVRRNARRFPEFSCSSLPRKRPRL